MGFHRGVRFNAQGLRGCSWNILKNITGSRVCRSWVRLIWSLDFSLKTSAVSGSNIFRHVTSLDAPKCAWVDHHPKP